MKTTIAFLASFCFIISGFTQDIIYFQNGTELKAKILEIKTDVISYKKTSNLSGPTYESSKKEIHKIKHQNGEIEIISPEDNDGKTGIGFKFISGDTIQITQTDKGSAAEEMGLLKGDKVIKIDLITKDKFLSESNVQNLLDGPVGSKVDITVLRTNQKTPFTFTLERKLPVIIVEPIVVIEKKDTVVVSNIDSTKKSKTQIPQDIDKIITSSKFFVGFQSGLLLNTCYYYAPPPVIASTYGIRPGYYVGFYYQRNFTPSIGLRTSLSFSGLGAAQTSSAPGDGITFNYMNMYVGFQYTLAKPWRFQPYFHAGPVFSVLLNGYQTFGGYTTQLTTDPLPIKFYDFGFYAGIGARVAVWKRLFVSAEYHAYIGVVNIEGDDSATGQITRNYTVGSFLFGAGWRFK